MMNRRFGTRSGGRATGTGAGKSGKGVCMGKGSIGRVIGWGCPFTLLLPLFPSLGPCGPPWAAP
eukprot:scaffold2639_cov361-Pavlova_lutheri.AAC.58